MANHGKNNFNSEQGRSGRDWRQRESATVLRILPIDEDANGITMTILFTSAKAMSRQLDVKVSGPRQRTTFR